MKKIDLEKLQEEAEKKAKKREKKKAKMKVSGTSARKLQRIIIEKAKSIDK